MVKILSQFFLNSAFSCERTTVPSLFSSFSDQDVNFVADLDGSGVLKFAGGDDAFAFIADVHEDFFGADFDDGAFDDFTLGDERATALLEGFFHCKHSDFNFLTVGRL